MTLTRKKLEKHAHEAKPQELEDLKFRLGAFYMYPEQLVFIDETSKDARESIWTMGMITKRKTSDCQLVFFKREAYFHLGCLQC